MLIRPGGIGRFGQSAAAESTPATPWGLLGADALSWYRMSDGEGLDYVPNRVFPDNVSDNMLFFTSGYLGSVTNGTVTVKAATGPGGQQTAALLSYASGATVSYFGPSVLPADDYVFRYQAENNVAGTISLRHGKTNTTTAYSTDSVTGAAFTAVADSFTANGSLSYSYGIGNNSGVAQAIRVDQFQLYRAADGAPPLFANEVLDLTFTKNIRLPGSLPITDGVLKVTATGQVFHAKLPAFPAHTALPGMTICATLLATGYTASRALVVAPADSTQPIHNTNGYLRFRFGHAYTTGQARSYIELVAPGIAYEAYMNLEAYPQVVVATFGAAGVNILVDGFEVGPSENVQTLTSPMAEAFLKYLGGQAPSATPPTTETNVKAELVEIGLSKAQISTSLAIEITDLMRQQAVDTGVAIMDSPYVTFTLGDSQSHGNPRETNSTPAHDMRMAVTPTAWVVPMGAAGSVLGYPGDTSSLSMYGVLARLLRNLTRAFNKGLKPRVVGWIGANDHARIISSAPTYGSDILTFLSLIRTHWTGLGGDPDDLVILWGDVPPRGNAGSFSTAAAFNAGRAVLNPGLAAAAGGGVIDQIIPIGSHPIMGPDAAVNDATLYEPSDLLHETRPLGASYWLASIVDVWEPYLAA